MNINKNNYAAVTFGWNRTATLAIRRPLVCCPGNNMIRVALKTARRQGVTRARCTLGIRRYTRHAILLRFIGVLALLSTLLDPTPSYAGSPWTHVQGRLIGEGFYGPTPIPGVVVTLYNQQFGRSGRAVSRQDGTFYFGSVPLGAYFVEVWFRNSPYPRTFRVFVNRMPFTNIGTFQLDMPMGVQSTQGAGAGRVYADWSQSGF